MLGGVQLAFSKGFRSARTIRKQHAERKLV